MSNPHATDSHMWLITLQSPLNGGFAVFTTNGTYTPPPGSTRHDAYQAIRQHLNRQDPDLTEANVLFFSLEPNHF